MNLVICLLCEGLLETSMGLGITLELTTIFFGGGDMVEPSLRA